MPLDGLRIPAIIPINVLFPVPFFPTITECEFFFKLKVNPENVIAQANAKFLQRFAAMEKIIKARDLDMSQMDLNALNKIWDEAKNGLAD